MTSLAKRVLVFGAAGQIGSYLCWRLAEEGHLLVSQYRTRAALHGILIQANLFNRNETVEVIERACLELGGLDVIVNCIGDFLYKPLLDNTPEEFESIIHSNLIISQQILHYGSKKLTDQGCGVIIGFGYDPLAWDRPKKKILAYQIAKLSQRLLFEGYREAFAHLRFELIEFQLSEVSAAQPDASLGVEVTSLDSIWKRVREAVNR